MEVEREGGGHKYIKCLEVILIQAKRCRNSNFRVLLERRTRESDMLTPKI